MDGSPPLTTDLVLQARDHDQRALETLIGYARPRLHRFVWGRLARYTGGADLVDDVTQEACLAVCTNLPRFTVPEVVTETPAVFHGWMYAIARAKVVDTQRRMMRAPEPVDELPESMDLTPGPEDVALSTAGLTVIRTAMDTLPDKVRQVLLLRASGYTAEAAGSRLGMSAAAVRTAQHRGLARLREVMGSREQPVDQAS